MRALLAANVAWVSAFLVIVGTVALGPALQSSPLSPSVAAAQESGNSFWIPSAASAIPLAFEGVPSYALGATAKLPLPRSVFPLDSDQPQTRSLRVPEDYTLSMAVILAKPGDHILISPGTYRVSRGMTVRKEGVVIRGVGEDPSEVVVEGNEKDPVFTVKADGVRFENFTITKGMRAIWIEESSGVVVDNMVFNGNIKQGVAVVNAGPDIIIQNSLFANSRSFIKDDGSEVAGQGIAVVLGSNGILIKDSIFRNSMGSGLYIWQADNVEIEKNSIINTQPHNSGRFGNGVSIFEAENIVFRDNVIEGNAANGFYIGGDNFPGGTVILEQNIIRQNGKNGIRADQQGTSVIVNNNQIVQNSECGVVALNGAVVEGSGNVIEDNGQTEGCSEEGL